MGIICENYSSCIREDKINCAHSKLHESNDHCRNLRCAYNNDILCKCSEKPLRKLKLKKLEKINEQKSSMCK